MIYGIEAAAEVGLFSANQASQSGAVTFNSARLVLPSITSTNNGYFSFAGWFQSDWDAGGNYGGVAFMVDPEGIYGSSLVGKSDNSVTFEAIGDWDLSEETGGILAAPPVISGTWQHVMGTIQTTPSRVVKMRVNDVDAGSSLSVYGPTFSPILSNGLPLWVGSDSVGSDFYVGSMCDVSIWPGVSFLTDGDISETTRRYFIDADGKRVDPSIVISLLGPPAVMLSGDADNFALNALGTSGALTIAEGSLTNAISSPP